MNKVKRFITNFKRRYETPWNNLKTQVAEEENKYKNIMNKVKRFITNFKQRYETPWNTPKDTNEMKKTKPKRRQTNKRPIYETES